MRAAQGRRITAAPAADVRRPIRLGISPPGQGNVPEMVELTRRAENVGFDTAVLSDHPGHTAPLAPLVAMAPAAPSVRVGTVVLNTGQRLVPGLPEPGLRWLATLLVGPTPAAAERIRRLNGHLGISYFIFNNTPGTSWRTLKRLVDSAKAPQ